MPDSFQGASPTSVVPCNGCRTCCQGDAIILHPEHGDDPTIYQTVKIPHPLTGEPVLMLDHKANGDCVYLGPKGCENYDNRPLICREYDCRKQFLSLTKAQRRSLVEQSLCSELQFTAGKKRAHTLTQEERGACIAKRKQSA